MLEVSNLDAFYGKTQALWGVSLRVDEKEIVALVGANGAGKTTLLNTISGSLRPASGHATFLGRKIDGLPPHAIATDVLYPRDGKRSATEQFLSASLCLRLASSTRRLFGVSSAPLSAGALLGGGDRYRDWRNFFTRVVNVNDVRKVISWEGCEGQQYGQTFEEMVFDPLNEELRRSVLVLVNGQSYLNLRGRLNRELNDGNEIALCPLMAGG